MLKDLFQATDENDHTRVFVLGVGDRILFECQVWGGCDRGRVHQSGLQWTARLQGLGKLRHLR